MLKINNPEYLWWLLVLVPVAILYVRTLRWKLRVKRSIGSSDLVTPLIDNYSPRRFFQKFILSISAVALCIMVLADIRIVLKSNEHEMAGVDMIIALDVSKSMGATDVAPARIDKAIALINLLIERADNNRIGLVVFAGQAYWQVPITSDLGMVKMMLENISPGMVPVQGTAIAKALTLCSQSPNTEDAGNKAVILISDGEDHDKDAEDVAKQIKEDNIVIYTVGVGSERGSFLKDQGSTSYKRDKEGKVVFSKINEKGLEKIAAIAGGNYYYLDNVEESAEHILSDIDQLEKHPMIDDAGKYTTFFPVLLAIVVLLLIIELLLPEVKKIPAVILIIGMSFCSNTATAQHNVDNLISKGNREYKNGNIEKAKGYYLDARVKNDKSDIAAYNLGVVYFITKQYTQAEESFKNVESNDNPTLRANAHYNSGLTFLREGMKAEAIESFKNVLRINPDDNDARENLQKVLNEIKKQSAKQKPQSKQLNKKQLDDLLKKLQQQEKELQKNRKQKVQTGMQPEKDW